MTKTTLLSEKHALLGKTTSITVTNKHYVTGNPIQDPFPGHLEKALFGMGCFWGVERKFWQVKNVYSTAVGYSGGITPNPNYDEVCTGMTGHCEVVLVIFDPKHVQYQLLLELFWENHNPTQGMRQGNDSGTQYRSSIYTFNTEQQEQASTSQIHYQNRLTKSGFGKITTEIAPASDFYYAEDYHQAYLAKNPNGYCGGAGLGVDFLQN
jgi:peptide-methionine (S)-S-oxide reductase